MQNPQEKSAGKDGSERPEQLAVTLAKALQAECDLLGTGRRAVALVGGRGVGSFAGYFYYRFELPEEILLRTTERATITVGRQEPITVEGNVISIDNQFLTIALPRDFGPILPEIQCAWDYDKQFGPVIEKLNQSVEQPGLMNLLFAPQSSDNTLAPPGEIPSIPSTPPDQIAALGRIFANKVTLVWGPRRSGKSHTLAIAAATYLKAGKSVLFVGPTNDIVDEMLLKTADVAKQLSINVDSAVSRVDLPSLQYADSVQPFSHEHKVETAREEKRKAFLERTRLLDAYWRIRVQQVLHEDFTARVQDLRGRAADIKRQMEVVTREINQLTEAIGKFQDASVLERIKKGFSKEEIESAQKHLADRQQQRKRLQGLHQNLADEILRTETQSPIPVDAMREFRLSMKRMDELGGLEKVTQAVEAFVAVDEAALFASGNFVATSVVTAFVDPMVRSRQFDMVLVDDAQMVNLPTLAALACLAKERLVVAGDPFLLQPESVGNTAMAQQWLQRDIFLHIAGTDELHRLFDWTEQNSSWVVLLASHFATTPKLSLFVGSIIYDDRINVFVPPTARGKIIFIDTSDLDARCRQYAGRKKMLPYNEPQGRRVVECVKLALSEPGRRAIDVGVVVPFTGPSLHIKRLLRMNAIPNVEVGTPASFDGVRKKAIILDTAMAGVDYTIRAIDDRKVGEHRIVRMFNTVFSCVGEDLYVLADMKHFKEMYKDRLFVRLLMLLEAEADEKRPSLMAGVKKFDEMDLERRAKLLEYSAAPTAGGQAKPARDVAPKDAEMELRMKMLDRQKDGKPVVPGRDFEKETYLAAMRVIGERTDVNLLSQFLGGETLFRTSYTAEEAMNRLPGMTCENEKRFRDVMELWNLLVYESSGGGGEDSVFAHTGPESRVRQDIRNFKALYSPDVRGVIEEGKQKIAVEVSRVFQDLLGKVQPANPVEWSAAYLNFLSRLESYLGWISEQVRR